jgi:hypothetical protein
MNLSKEKLKDIAGDLQLGLKCFIHQKTGELVSIVDPDQIDDDDELWKEEIEKVKDKNFIEIEPMTSTESFEVMEDFVNTLDEGPTKIRLETALEGKKPFANFKFQIDNSEYRQSWFAFKDEKYIEWLADQLGTE